MIIEVEWLVRVVDGPEEADKEKAATVYLIHCTSTRNAELTVETHLQQTPALNMVSV